MGQPVEPARRPGRPLTPRTAAAPGVERRRALDVLREVDRGGRADESLTRHADGLDSRQRAFLMELTYGAVRWRGRLDHHLDDLLAEGLASIPPDVARILRLGAYQLMFMDRVPAWSAVDESVRLARNALPPKERVWAAGLVNGVLRAFARRREDLPLPDPSDPVAHLSVKYSHPRWMVVRWLARLGAATTEALLVHNNVPPPLHLALHPGRVTPRGSLEAIRAAGHDARLHSEKPDAVVVDPGVRPDTLPGWAEGTLWAQDVAAQWVVELVQPPPGVWWLDACAAPGAKLVGLVARAPDSRVLALDLDLERLARVRENLDRLGLSGAALVAADARALPARGPFGVVLADVPCSGTGVLRRRVDARWRRRPEDVQTFATFQRAVLTAVAVAVEAGGTLVYSTCSLEPEENEDVVAEFLAVTPGFRVDPVPDVIPAAHRNGPFLATRPWAADVDGMFAARLVREAA